MAIEYAVIAGGCFWCTEAVFKDVIGVESVESGYTGGARPNPTYEQVCSGATGHAEAIRIGFDPEKVSFGDLLDISFVTHDPTQLNRQGNDIGTQYRSAIFPANAEQEAEAASKAIEQGQPLSANLQADVRIARQLDAGAADANRAGRGSSPSSGRSPRPPGPSC